MIINRIVLPLFLLLSCELGAQQALLTPSPLSGALHITPDGLGGLYATVFSGHEPAIVHLSAAGDVRTLVTEYDVRHEDEHQEEGEFLLLHMPSESWLSGDGTQLLFPVFRHVHPWHLSEIMLLDRGKVSTLLSVNQKLRYALDGQTHERYMINGRKASLAYGRVQVYSFLSAFSSSDLGERALGHLSQVSFAYHWPATGARDTDVTMFVDLDFEDPKYSIVEPGCMSRSNYLFAIGVASTGFFSVPSFTIFQVDQQGRRETLATDVLLRESAFACTAGETSVIYRDGTGRMHLASVRDGERPRRVFEGSTIDGVPAGEPTHHAVTADGLHYFLMKAPDGRQGLFTVDAQGRAASVLAPGFAGSGRVAKGIAVSGAQIYLLTDVAEVQVPASNAKVLALQAGRGSGLAPPRIVNAASFDDTLSPGAWASIFGQSPASSTVTAAALPLPTELGGIVVKVDGATAPLSLVSPTQINFLVPWELGAPTDVEVQVLQNGVALAAARMRIDPVSPGIFRAGGTGLSLITTADYRLVDQRNPCRAGAVCILWANGLGRTNKTIASGHASPADAAVLEPPTLLINGRPASIVFAGLAPGLAGAYQVNFVMPVDWSGAAGTQRTALVNGTLKQGSRESSFQIQGGSIE